MAEKKKKWFSNHDSITNSAPLRKETIKSETALVRVPQTSQNLVISSRCCCAEDGKEIQEKLYRNCTIIVQLFNSFVWRCSPCPRRRGLPNLLIAFGMRIVTCSWLPKLSMFPLSQCWKAEIVFMDPRNKTYAHLSGLVCCIVLFELITCYRESSSVQVGITL